MTELAQRYLGNYLQESELAQQVEDHRRDRTCLEVYLSPADSLKGRIHAQSTSGESVGIIRGRERPLVDGDVFSTERDRLVVVHLEDQKVIVLSFAGEASGHELNLIHLGHTLGNHHWPILVQSDRIYVQLAADATLIEATIRSFAIPGLLIHYESRSPGQQIFFTAHTHPT